MNPDRITSDKKLCRRNTLPRCSRINNSMKGVMQGLFQILGSPSCGGLVKIYRYLGNLFRWIEYLPINLGHPYAATVQAWLLSTSADQPQNHESRPPVPTTLGRMLCQKNPTSSSEIYINEEVPLPVTLHTTSSSHSTSSPSTLVKIIRSS